MESIKGSRRFPFRPYLLNDINQLSGGLLVLAKKYLPDNQPVKGIFVIPPDSIPKGSRRRNLSTEALIFTHQGILQLAEPDKTGRGGFGTWLAGEDILMTKLSLILLYGKLEMWGFHQEQALKIEAEYNTVSHHLLAPFLRNLIRSTWESNRPVEASQIENIPFDELNTISFSFYNGLVNEAIQPGEMIVDYLHQPELRKQWMKIFYRKVVPQTVITRTNQQIILLQEDLKFKTHHEWIFTFIPLYRISRIDREAFQDWMKITIHLLPECSQKKIDLLLDLQRAQKLDDICRDITNGLSG